MGVVMKYLFLIIVLTILFVAITFVTLRGVQLSNEQYDRLKYIVIRWSGIVTLLAVLVKTFDIAYGQETITVVAAIGAFLAYMMHISDQNYNDGANVQGLTTMEDDFDDIIAEELQDLTEGENESDDI